MKILYRLCLLCISGVAALSASPSVNPQDPTFLDSFNDQQKLAIQKFLGLELGENSNGPLDENVLKEFYAQLIQKWSQAFGDLPKLESSQPRKCCTRKTADYDLLAKKLTDTSHNFAKSPLTSSITITPDDIGTKGIRIKRSGHYILKNCRGTFYWNPSRITDMITIDADNVILDLNDTTITQRSQNDNASRAITIRPGHKNITIRNGSLVGFTADAILSVLTNQLTIENVSITDNANRQAYTPTLGFASVNVEGCLNVVLRDLTVRHTVVNSSDDIIGAGILVLGTRTFLIENCRVSEAEVDATESIGSQCIGISTILSDNGVVRNCTVSNCRSSGVMPGFGYIITQDILTENCAANFNTGVQTTSGYYPQISDSLQFVNCDANNNHSTCQDCHGFPYFISSNGYISNCRAFNNQAVNPTGGYNEKMTGFEILVCRNCVVEDCVASDNIATRPIRHYAAGFANGNSDNVVFRNCTSIGNTALGNEGRGIGFGPALDPRFFGTCFGTIWENCIAEGNFGDTMSIGFDIFGQVGAIVLNCISQNHGNAIFNNGIGIRSNGPYDEGNPVDVPCDVVPIVVMTNNTGTNTIVKGNIVANNTHAGIEDTTGANNMYVDNTVFNNGTNFIGSIFSTGTPIRSWTLQSAPSPDNNNTVVGDKTDNLNVNNP